MSRSLKGKIGLENAKPKAAAVEFLSIDSMMNHHDCRKCIFIN